MLCAQKYHNEVTLQEVEATLNQAFADLESNGHELIFKQIRHADKEGWKYLTIQHFDEDDDYEDDNYVVEDSGDSTDSVDEDGIDTDYTVDSEIAI